MIFSGVCHVVASGSLLLILTATPTGVSYWISQATLLLAFLYASYLLGDLLDTLPRFRVTANKKAVLITGCDTGFGHLLAHRLDSIGYKVFAGCIGSSSENVQKLRDISSPRLVVVPLDVTDDKSVANSLKTVHKGLGDCKLWAVVNNAGIIVRGELEWTPLEDYQKQFEVNTFGVVRVTQAFLPLLKESRGRVVCTSSFGGRYTMPGLASYCMSKFAANSFCDGLRLEMEKFHVKVVTVEPFAYRSPMTDMSTVLKSAEDTWSKAPEDLKQYYGHNYIEAFQKSLQKFNELSTNPRIHDVVDQQVEAVTVTNPHYRYTVSDIKSKFVFRVIDKLPLWMGYKIVQKFVTFDDETRTFIERNRRSNVSSNGHK